MEEIRSLPYKYRAGSTKILSAGASLKPCVKHPKHSITQEPRTNCTDCWDYYFRYHTGRLIGLEQMMKQLGKERVVTIIGTKYVKQLERFTKQHGL